MLNVSVKFINYRNKLFIYTEDINFTMSFIIKEVHRYFVLCFLATQEFVLKKKSNKD